jgi:hypothetical protein
MARERRNLHTIYFDKYYPILLKIALLCVIMPETTDVLSAEFLDSSAHKLSGKIK